MPRLGRWAVGTGPPGNGPPRLSPVTSPGLCSPCPSASWGVPAILFLLPLPGQGARRWSGREPLGPASGAWEPMLTLGLSSAELLLPQPLVLGPLQSRFEGPEPFPQEGELPSGLWLVPRGRS